MQLVAICSQPRSLVDEFVEKTGATHPIAIVESSMIDAMGVKGYPTSFLVGPNGRIVWTDHPSRLTEALIEQHLASVRTLPDLPKALAPVGKAVDKNKMVEALTKLEKYLEAEGLGDEDRSAAEQLRDWILWRGTSGIEGAEADVAGGRIYDAWEVYDWVASAFKGHELGTRADGAVKELLADKDHKREIDAGKRLAKALEQCSGMSAKKIIGVLTPIAKKYKGTRAGTRAAERIAQLERDD